MIGGAFTSAAAKFLEEIDNPVLDKPIDHVLLRQVLRDVARQVGNVRP